MELAKMPCLKLELGKFVSCKMSECPFFKECPGGEKAGSRDSAFFCDIEKLKKTYKILTT